MTLGGRVAVLRDGAIEQVAPPLDVYAEPVNTFVARFIGAPPMNLVPAALLAIDAAPGVLAGVRPQDVALVTSGSLRATVDFVEPRGHDSVVHLRLDSPAADPFLAVVAGAAPPPPGSQVFVRIAPDRLHLFDGRYGVRMKR